MDRQWYLRMCLSYFHVVLCGLLVGDVHGVHDQAIQRHRVIGHAIDKGTIGTVLQKAAHQISQQCFVGSDRCVDATRSIQVLCTHHLKIQGLPHAMQALKLILTGLISTAHFFGHAHNAGECLRVVRCKLWVHHINSRQQFACAGQVGHVGMVLAREHGVIGLTFHLRPLNFAVPIGTLDQTNHQTMA